jgi:hypothetical protein
MSNCLQPTALSELAQSTLSTFEERVSKIPPDFCSAFHGEARTLEGQLLTIYKLVAICSRDEDDLDQVSANWALMVRVCDMFADKLQGLNKQHPNCGAEVYYDKILDLRNKCRRLSEMHAAA